MAEVLLKRYQILLLFLYDPDLQFGRRPFVSGHVRGHQGEPAGARVDRQRQRRHATLPSGHPAAQTELST